MRLFNTMTQHVEDFVAPTDGPVRLYVCGVTPYDTAHLGHAFVYATFDTLVRTLQAQGHTVDYTENVTDIDDPLFAKAKELGNITWDELARRETERFLHEMGAINVAMPNHYVRASDELPTMFAMIAQLLANGHAYVSDGWIYFDHTSDPSYGQLAEAAGFHGYAALLAEANEHGNVPDDPRKRDPLDFMLWRGETPGEPSWPSPFGPGRPGWHIECSAMSTRYLGPQLDIHGGGRDLIFPHHSSEIAQAENASGQRPFVRVWMHTGMVALGGTKMSKSLGNLIIVGKLLETNTPDAIRLLLARHHYRSDWDYFPDDMATAQTLADRLLAAADAGEMVPRPLPAGVLWQMRTEQPAIDEFLTAMEDDLDTPRAVATLDALARDLLAGTFSAAEGMVTRQALRAAASLLGLRLRRAE
ncbi:MAG: cysteine--tRNA ligase [Ktedonobacterales bacterium]|nr:cysteine--tRNA ligase [Ktedonobacterales bacterium]